MALLAKRTAISSALAALVEQNQEWQLALRRQAFDAPELKRRGLEITEKIEGFTAECQRLLVRTSAIDKLEQMHHAIAETTLMIAGSPQRTESRALDVAETNKLRTLIERIAKAQAAIESLEADRPEALPDAPEHKSHAD